MIEERKKGIFRDSYGDIRDIWKIFGWFCFIMVCVSIFICVLMIPFYIGACIEADIINENHGTDYSCSDLFWAGDSIKSVVEGNRERIDLNIEGKDIIIGGQNENKLE